MTRYRQDTCGVLTEFNLVIAAFNEVLAASHDGLAASYGKIANVQYIYVC